MITSGVRVCLSLASVTLSGVNVVTTLLGRFVIHFHGRHTRWRAEQISTRHRQLSKGPGDQAGGSAAAVPRQLPVGVR